MRCQGLTLPELLLALACAAILLSMGTPALAGLLHETRGRLEAGRVFSALLLARNEAISRGLPVLFCPGNASAEQAHNCAGNYRDGWLLFVDVNGDARFDPAQDEPLRAYSPMPANYALLNRAGTAAPAGRLGYSPDGTTGRSLTLQVCVPVALPRGAWSVVLSPVGRPRLARGWGECPA